MHSFWLLTCTLVTKNDIHKDCPAKIQNPNRKHGHGWLDPINRLKRAPQTCVFYRIDDNDNTKTEPLAVLANGSRDLAHLAMR